MRQTGREQPWSIRRVSHRHLHDHKNLIDLHLLTQSWAPESKQDPFANEPSLEDDTTPDDVLLRLDHAIRMQQLKTIEGMRQEAPVLAERSFQAGQESAARRWMLPGAEGGSIAPADKRALLLALFHSPLAGRLGPHAFLVRRRLVTEVTVELLNCPHRQVAEGDSTATPEARDELCRQHFSWLRGYFNFLNPAIVPGYSRPRGRCVISW